MALKVHWAGQDERQFHVVTELIGGRSLDDRMEDEKRISELQALQVGIQKGLQAASRTE